MRRLEEDRAALSWGWSREQAGVPLQTIAGVCSAAVALRTCTFRYPLPTDCLPDVFCHKLALSIFHIRADVLCRAVV